MSDGPTILVTGGAGYIGAHACLRLAEAGYRPVVYDDLSNGHADAVRWGPLEVGDIRDPARLTQVFTRHRPAAVMHFAALIEVGESVKHPQAFYDVNVGGALHVIGAAIRAGVDAFVFSSTCATYGEPQAMPMAEDHPQQPVNPYGHGKLMVERALREVGEAAGLRSVALRYFNAAGAEPSGLIGERHDPETHALPLLLRAIDGDGPPFSLFGTDYATRDGSAERDYIHVLDLADAHVLALRHLLDGGPSDAFNVGTGTGTTVRELAGAARAATGRDVPLVERPRRPGDAAALVADPSRIKALGWSPAHDLDAIVASAWAWHNVSKVRDEARAA